MLNHTDPSTTVRARPDLFEIHPRTPEETLIENAQAKSIIQGTVDILNGQPTTKHMRLNER